MRSLVLLMTLLMAASGASAADSDVTAQVTCQAIYYNNGSTMMSYSTVGNVADSSADIFIINPQVANTTVEIQIMQDPLTSQLSGSAVVGQTQEVAEGESSQSLVYSNTTEADSAPSSGSVLDFGMLHLNQVVTTENGPVTDISTSCVVN